MKKLWLYVCILSFLLIGCSNSENIKSVEERNTIEKEERPLEEVDINEENADVEEEERAPLYKINPVTFRVEPIAFANEKVVLLTIDDAPDKYAVEMAHTLKKLEANAIFFVNGHFIANEEGRTKLKEIHELGFLIGNHTWNHKELPTLTEEEQINEIVLLNDEIEKIIGERPKFFRAPFGQNSDITRKIAEDEKMVLMNWSYGYDFMKDYMTKEALANIMVNTELLSNGANLLMHDREWTNAALEEIVIGLRDKGYEIVDPHLLQTL